MPRSTANRRNTALRLVCQRPGCGTVYAPMKGREPGKPNEQRFCSRECARSYGVYTRRGRWPEPANVPTPTPAEPPAQDMAVRLAAFHEACEQAARDDAFAGRILERDARQHGEQGRTLILAGMGAYLGVQNGALVVHQGRTHGAPGRRDVLQPALHDVNRLLVLDGTGTVTIPALAWCQREGIALTVLDAGGRVLAQSMPEAPLNATLRRAQYMAQASGRDVELARAILTRKLTGQRVTLDLDGVLLATDALCRARDALDMALSWLALPNGPTPFLSTVAGLMAYEATCARAYWECLASLPLLWRPSDTRAGKVPQHWQTVGPRNSPLAPHGNARHAVRPAHAVWNLAYAALASDIRAALLAAGLDPACGFLHADAAGRESLVWDMVELRRGDVDAHCLRFLASTTLRPAHFERQPDGGLRLAPSFARLVLASCRASRADLAADAQWLATMLLAPAPAGERKDMRAHTVPTAAVFRTRKRALASANVSAAH